MYLSSTNCALVFADHIGRAPPRLGATVAAAGTSVSVRMATTTMMDDSMVWFQFLQFSIDSFSSSFDEDFIDEILIDIKMLGYDLCACEWY